MKKILVLVMALITVLSLSACGGEAKEPTSSTEAVDPNTVEIVNNAYNKTTELLKSTKALGFESVTVASTKIDDVVTTVNVTAGIDCIENESGRKYAMDTVIKLGDTSQQVQYYGDGKSTYAYAAGTTYLVANGKETDEYIAGILSEVEVLDVGDCPVLKTTIIDSSVGGHCYVIEYDATKFDPEKIFGEYYAEAKKAGTNIKPQKLTVSGTIDSQGRLTSQNVTFEYNYDMNIQTEVSDVSKTESTASKTSSKTDSKKDKTSSKAETSSEAPATTTVVKNVSCVLKCNVSLDYDIEEIKVPDLMLIGKDADGNDIKNPEISIPDFNKLSGNSSTSSNTETDKK